LKEKINELDRNSKINGVRGLRRGIHEFKERFQPRCNLVMSEIADMLAGSSGILIGVTIMSLSLTS
jgi:hypothetical protein